MIDVETVERLVATKMELSGLMDEGCEGMCKAILTRLYTAVDLWRLLLPFENGTHCLPRTSASTCF